MSRTISLTNGGVTIVDDADYEWLNQYSWRGVGTRWRYALTCIPGVLNQAGKPKTISMHRLILDLVDKPRSIYGDHINGNTLDNQRKNLRITDNKGNQGNRRRKNDGFTSRYRGVVWNKTCRKWNARIRLDRKLKHIGFFESEEEAAIAYDIVAKLHFGDFAVPNLPDKADGYAQWFINRLGGDRNESSQSPGAKRGDGVSLGSKSKWEAYVYDSGKKRHIGYFTTREEAMKARREYLRNE